MKLGYIALRLQRGGAPQSRRGGPLVAIVMGDLVAERNVGRLRMLETVSRRGWGGPNTWSPPRQGGIAPPICPR